MNTAKLICIAVVTLSLSTIAQASIITLDFTAPDSFGNPTYSEDGFTVAHTTENTDIFQNALIEGVLSVGETISITQDNGGNFSLVSFDYGSPSSSNMIDAFDMLGFLNSILVTDYGNFVSSSPGFTTALGNATAVDELRIVGTSQNSASPYWDNIVLNTVDVPEPAALGLLGLGLLGLSLSSRRQLRI